MSPFLVLYTDGITEAMAPLRGRGQALNSRELFGVDRLDRLLLEPGGDSAQGCVDRIRTAVAEFSENVSTDDQMLIALRCIA